MAIPKLNAGTGECEKMFPQDLKTPPPRPAEDLSYFDTERSEVSISGSTRGIEVLKRCVRIDRVWVTKVGQEEFARIARFINPVSLVVYDMKVRDLSPLADLLQ
jgi:hypothetical protein